MDTVAIASLILLAIAGPTYLVSRYLFSRFGREGYVMPAVLSAVVVLALLALTGADFSRTQGGAAPWIGGLLAVPTLAGVAGVYVGIRQRAR